MSSVDEYDLPSSSDDEIKDIENYDRFQAAIDAEPGLQSELEDLIRAPDQLSVFVDRCLNDPDFDQKRIIVILGIISTAKFQNEHPNLDPYLRRLQRQIRELVRQIEPSSLDVPQIWSAERYFQGHMRACNIDLAESINNNLYFLPSEEYLYADFTLYATPTIIPSAVFSTEPIVKVKPARVPKVKQVLSAQTSAAGLDTDEVARRDDAALQLRRCRAFGGWVCELSRGEGAGEGSFLVPLNYAIVVKDSQGKTFENRFDFAMCCKRNFFSVLSFDLDLDDEEDWAKLKQIYDLLVTPIIAKSTTNRIYEKSFIVDMTNHNICRVFEELHNISSDLASTGMWYSRVILSMSEDEFQEVGDAYGPLCRTTAQQIEGEHNYLAIADRWLPDFDE